MNKDPRWKIWLYVHQDLEQWLPAARSFFQSEDLAYDYENEWEWLAGFSPRFGTSINISRKHDFGVSLYTHPIIILTNFDEGDPEALKQTQRIALEMTQVFRNIIHFGWATLDENDNHILEPVGRFQRQAINIKIANRDGTEEIPRPIDIDEQDRETEAWKKLCSYIEQAAAGNADEFILQEAVDAELFVQINTLPESIGRLTRLTKVHLYGSKISYLPPQIGEWKGLQYFNPYTSYNLHWFPYEIMHCTRLKDSRVSTRVLYGNYKNRLPFPDLRAHTIKYGSEHVNCSICRKQMTYEQTDQLWISLKTGTDVLPLLVNACSPECIDALPTPPEGYLPWPHKGGEHLLQPLDEDQLFYLENGADPESALADETIQENDEWPNEKTGESRQPDGNTNSLIDLIKKIWK